MLKFAFGYLLGTCFFSAILASPCLAIPPNPPTNVRTVSTATYPAEILDLSNWKQTLPTGPSESPTEIRQPELSTFKDDIFFSISSSHDAVRFRAPVNGVTTKGSGYPRSELREMTNGGQDNANWSTTGGIHTMIIDQAITAVPLTKQHVVAGQIHDANDDVIVVRLEFPKLYIDINGVDGPVLDSNYVLGRRFRIKFEASNGQVRMYYNGSAVPSYTLVQNASGCYFKAGVYTQSNCTKESSCSSSNFGEVTIYDLKVTHSN